MLIYVDFVKIFVLDVPGNTNRTTRDGKVPEFSSKDRKPQTSNVNVSTLMFAPSSMFYFASEKDQKRPKKTNT